MGGERTRRDRLSAIWEYLHAHPEPSMQEFGTAEYLAELMRAGGLDPRPFKDFPGFTVDVGPGAPVVGLRADMDALIHEQDGGPVAIHSCGHDAHMAIVATVMLELAELGGRLGGAVRAIFQPAEESGNGAELVAGLGVADELTYLFGVHLRPKAELPSPRLAPSISHGACQFAVGTITGEDHHGARPHQGVNAIELALGIAQGLARIKCDPQVPHSAKMTMLQAGGETHNVIPGSSRFAVDLRAQSNEAMAVLREGLLALCSQAAASTGSVIDLEFHDAVPAAVIGPRAEATLAAAVDAELGPGHLVPGLVTSGSDDFHFYTIRNPGLQASMLAVGADLEPGLHHPSMTFEFDAMERAVAVVRAACLRAVTR
ncbi:amidohydrolase [Arthrobacter cavernae]|uniref:Amidohydrolase n=1 Tax=Arthrobacter cavernae TaxID=2817681 RepID=A0A939KL10_9MICC|nr:amidohydrolase [Arthrobacter cavernae]MBO1266656.1 amidohydrolase [Arthrobacter cavernae]